MSGWIKLYRKLCESSMYSQLNSKQRDVMIQCLLMANHSENQWEFDGEIINCGKGEFITSLDGIARKCAMDVKVQSVRSALLKLEKWGFLTNKSTKTGRHITICKWETYQSQEDKANNQPNRQPTKLQQRANKEPTANKNDKKVKNDKNNTIIEEIYQAYPKKVGRGQAIKAIKSALKKVDPDKLLSRVKAYEENRQGQDHQYTKNPATWFNGECWLDELVAVTDSAALRKQAEREASIEAFKGCQN